MFPKFFRTTCGHGIVFAVAWQDANHTYRRLRGGYSSVVRKAGSFEGTLSRCFFARKRTAQRVSEKVEQPSKNAASTAIHDARQGPEASLLDGGYNPLIAIRVTPSAVSSTRSDGRMNGGDSTIPSLIQVLTTFEASTNRPVR